MMPLSQPKRKRCKQCSSLYEPYNSLQIACSPKCALDLVKTTEGKQKVTKIKRQQNNKERKENRPIAAFKKQAQKAVNAYVRARDRSAGYGCISCENGGIDHAGHYYTVGGNDGLRFDDRLIHGQCVACNVFKSGNLESYQRGIIARYGEDYWQMMVSAKAEQKSGKAYDREMLEHIRKDYTAKEKLFNNNEA